MKPSAWPSAKKLLPPKQKQKEKKLLPSAEASAFGRSFCLRSTPGFTALGDIVFNAAQPGVGRVQVLGSKKFQCQTELLFGVDIKIYK